MVFTNRKIRRKEWRKLVKKKRRKLIRQKKAQQRDSLETALEEQRCACPEYQQQLVEKNRQEQIAADREELERALRNAVWLEKEHKLQQKFEQARQEQQAKERDNVEKREKIRQEFEERERQLLQAKTERLQQEEQVRKVVLERQVKLQEFASAGIGDYLKELQTIYNTRENVENCKFFVKTGACRHGFRCSLNHPTPGLSKLILIPNFFNHPALEHMVHAEYGHDSRLEFDEDDLKSSFAEFFRDIVVEFEVFGNIQHIFVCQNSVCHLRGNVYIQYETLRNSAAAYLRMNGRFYAKKQLLVEFRSPIVWPMAVCGLFELKRCTKGSGCNFLHILRNPINRYVYNHFQECRSLQRKTIKSGATPLTQKSWDEITLNEQQTASNATQCRWSESPEQDNAVINHKLSDRSKDQRCDQKRRDKTETKGSRSRRSRSRDRSLSGSRSRNRSVRKRNRSRRSRSRSRSHSHSRRKSGKSKRGHDSNRRHDKDTHERTTKEQCRKKKSNKSCD
ncbi:U2 small nuclear ribonucleoprotein auxiliary factor 35 kDa subunit-related protein 2 [Anopheles nili]|uniref:U2 small nuclear ribonucleoprotein auxiliary factor 35 kDa subunit-related protein 2 n=1 Tax=Anopheles nili TaxID=185578 RepID=UPI00237C31EB|nr:U2 small nuclear ribonucleoprotein auxiliary factor 35 kDa subunit-related protein 2 [Anopheles nili]